MSAGAFKQALSNLRQQKTEKTKNRNFRPREAREFLGSWDKKSNTVKTQKFHTSGVCLREDKNSRTKLGQLFQRTPWGGGKKRGVENLTNDTPPKKGFWTPLVRYVFHPPSRVSALFFLYRNPRQSRPEALLEGSKNFRESAFSGTFSTPHTFCTPPYHGPIIRIFGICVLRMLVA